MLRSVIIQDGDTIENVALVETGSAANWQTLAAFNHLQYPFISNDPRDYYGTALARGLVPAALIAGGVDVPLVTIPSNGPAAALIDVGGTLLLVQRDRAGVLITDALTVASYNPVSGVLKANAPLEHNYDANAAWYLYPFERPLGVLRSGDQLLIPLGGDLTIRSTDRLTDFLGTDIAMDDHGSLALSLATKASGFVTLTASPPPGGNLLIPAGLQLRATDGTLFVTSEDAIMPAGIGSFTSVDVLVHSFVTGHDATVPAHAIDTVVPASAAPIIFSTITGVDNPQALTGLDGTGDFLLASGLSNMQQAVVMRLSTRLGELPHFPDYGDQAFAYVGASNRAVEAARIEAAVINCVASDDRVSAVAGSPIIRTADGIAINIDIFLRGLDYRLTLRDLQIALLQ